MIIHFDADLLVYRCAFAAEKKHRYLTVYDDYDEETISHWAAARDMKDHIETLPKGTRYEVEAVREAEPVENALFLVPRMVDAVLEKLACSESDLIMYLSGSDNFRDGVATIKPYKGNRDKAERPVHGPAIRKFIKDKYNTKVSVEEEADDEIGYSHYAMYCQDPHSSLICTVDKDMDMIPGMHYNFVKEESYFVDEDQADRIFYMQLLTGDGVDNIPGLPRVGPATAAKMLKDKTTVLSMYEVAKKAYAEKYEHGMDALRENARLLWIRRRPGEWWQPPVEEDWDAE
jgi:hypothetical protein